MQRPGVALAFLAVVLAPVATLPVTAQELSTAEPLLEEIARAAADPTKSLPERIEAIVTLGRWGTAQVEPALVALLGDPNPVIRAQAARALGWEGNEAAVKALLARLTSPTEAGTVRARAAVSLGTIGSVEAKDALLAAVGDADAELRLAAMEALAFGALKSAVDPVPVMIALLADARQPRPARGRAAQGLGEAKDPRGFDVLLETLEHGPPGDLVPFTYQPKSQAETFQMRLRVLGDVRAWSAQALGQLGDRRAVPALQAASEDPDDYFLRLKAVEALVQLQDPRAVPVFLKALADPFPPVRYGGMAGAGLLRVADAVDPLLAMLAGPDAEFRLRAAATLGAIGDGRAREPLSRLAALDPDPRVRAVAEGALRRLPPAN